MKHLLLIACIVIPSFILAQDKSQGIQFQTTLTWSQVKEQASKENRFIFVDCYATWCVPCKIMDDEVYPKSHVGEYMNDKFISVKLQADTSDKDDEFTKRLYADARRVQTENNVTGFPTFLFFAPSGEIVHRFTGLLDDSNFIKLAIQTLDTSKQYYTLLRKYISGTRNYTAMKYLVKCAKNSGDNLIASKIAREYIEDFLNMQTASALLKKDEIEFVGRNLDQLRSSDSVFKFIQTNADAVNKIMDFSTFVQAVVCSIITKEEINIYLWPHDKQARVSPDWNKLFRSIAKKYNEEYAKTTVLDAKLRWYTEKNDWGNVIKYNIEKVESSDFDTTILAKYSLNNLVWYVLFKHGTKKEHLNKGVMWMKKIIATTPDDPALIDTYANILYKAGKTKEAIQWEMKALEIETREALAQDRQVNPRLQLRIDLMRKGLPTWTMKE